MDLVEIVETVEELVSDARRVSQALQVGNMDVVASCLNSYCNEKKIMDGPNSGVESGRSYTCLKRLFAGWMVPQELNWSQYQIWGKYYG